jgi:hypothetical protein
VGVVVDVGLPEVLFLGVFVRLVVVFHGRVVVLVRMGGRHVFPLGAVPEVVHDVGVLVGMNDGVMGVLHGRPFCYPAVRAGACSRYHGSLLIKSVRVSEPVAPGTVVTFGRRRVVIRACGAGYASVDTDPVIRSMCW